MDTPPYRPAKELNEKLNSYACNLLDEDHFIGVIGFLSNLLHAGTSLSSQPQSSAIAPSPEFLAVLSTIVVHPLFTIRATSEARAEASNSALRFLYDVNKSIGPFNAGYSEAFQFRSEREQRLISRRHSLPPDVDSDDGLDSPTKNSNFKYAQAESVWWQVDDFWAVVGWSFNCSLKHAQRWERWKLWLAWFIDALERDWEERIRLAKKALQDDDDADKARELISTSLIYRNLIHVSSRSDRRRVMRAILTDGVNQKPLAEFKEVWINETKEKKVKEEDTEPRKKLNLDDGEYGDYDVYEDEDSIMEDPVANSDGSDPAKKTRPKGSKKQTKLSKDPFQLGTADFGGVDAVDLRQRLLALLYKVALELPHDFTSPESILDIFTEFMRDLPFPQFAVLASKPCIKPTDYISLLANLLIPLAQAPEPKGGTFHLSQDDLIRHYFPAAATSQSAVENAKISLVLEAMLKGLMVAGALAENEFFGDIVQNGQLGEAVERGIKARQKKALVDSRRRKNSDEGEEMAREELKRSGRRLMALLEVVEESNGIAHDRAGRLPEQSSQLTEISELSSELSSHETAE